MKYLIRSIKYFFYFGVITTLIILALVVIGAVEGDINAIFDDGYDSLWKIAAFFAVVAAVYPKFGFYSRRLEVTADWEEVREKAKTFFQEKPFVLESEGEGHISFRRRDILSRITKMYEDRITLTKTDEGYFLEGLRKDVILYAAGFERSFPVATEE